MHCHLLVLVVICSCEYVRPQSNNLRVVHSNEIQYNEQNSLNQNPFWQISDDIDENIATIQYSLNSLNTLQTTMQSVYQSYINTKIEEYMQQIESIMQSLMKDIYNTIKNEIQQQLITNITSTLSQLNNYKQNDGQSQTTEMKQIMINYYKAKEASFKTLGTDVKDTILSNEEIPKMVQQVLSDAYQLIMPIKGFLSDIGPPARSPKMPYLQNDASLWILPHALPYIDQIKNELIENNVTFNDTARYLNREEFIDLYQYRVMWTPEDPLTNILPNYDYHLNKFFDKITAIQDGSNLDVNKSVMIFEIDRDSIDDEWNFVFNTLGSGFMGEYILKHNANTINGKCMKWWKDEYGEQATKGFNLGCVLFC